MIDAAELTIRDYLDQLASSGAKIDKSVSLLMCELLTTSYDAASCEGAPDESPELCDIETSITFTKHALDWAYQQATKGLT